MQFKTERNANYQYIEITLPIRNVPCFVIYQAGLEINLKLINNQYYYIRTVKNGKKAYMYYEQMQVTQNKADQDPHFDRIHISSTYHSHKVPHTLNACQADFPGLSFQEATFCVGGGGDKKGFFWVNL